MQNASSIILEDNPELSGTIPSEIGLLNRLNELSLQRTSIQGTLPTEFYQLSTLDYLRLGNTQLSGTISTKIALLQELRALHIEGTFISGTIPEEIASIGELMELRVNGNPYLTGSIPDELCNSMLQPSRGHVWAAGGIVADCDPSSAGVAAMSCPESCCAVCCDQETEICMEQ